MLRLVESEFATARQLDGGTDSPALLVNFRAADVLGFEQLDLRGEIVAHKVENRSQLPLAAVHHLPAGFIRRMNRGLGGWKLEDEPATSGVNRGVLENVAKEGAIGLGIFAVKKNVSADKHAKSLAGKDCIHEKHVTA